MSQISSTLRRVPQIVRVLYWPVRLGGPDKSLTGHISLVGPSFHVSWSPVWEERTNSVKNTVGAGPVPSPSSSDAQNELSDDAKFEVAISGLDVAAMKRTYESRAAGHVNPEFIGPPMGYSLFGKAAGESCASMVMEILKAGGSEEFVKAPDPLIAHTPRSVYQYAERVRKKSE